MYVYSGLRSLQAVLLIIFEVVTQIHTYIHTYIHTPFPLIDSAHPVGWAEWKKSEVVVEVCPCELLLVSFVQISGEKMKPKFKKVLHLFEELEEAGKSAIVTISLRKRIPPSSSCPKPQQQLKHPCHQHLGSAAAIEVQLQELAADSGQPTFKLPSWLHH